MLSLQIINWDCKKTSWFTKHRILLNVGSLVSDDDEDHDGKTECGVVSIYEAVN